MKNAVNASPGIDGERSEPLWGHLYLHGGDNLLLYRGTVTRSATTVWRLEQHVFLKVAAREPPRPPTHTGHWYRYLTDKVAKNLPEVLPDELPQFIDWEWKDLSFDLLLKGETIP